MGKAESPKVDRPCGGNIINAKYRDESRILGRSLEQTPSLFLGVKVQPRRQGSWQEQSSSGLCQVAGQCTASLVPCCLCCFLMARA